MCNEVCKFNDGMAVNRSMNIWLIIAGVLSAIAAFLHLGCIYFGAQWYRFFGAGEHMAMLAEQGSIEPVLITAAIASVLFTWSLYAFSAAGLIVKLPLIRTALLLITLIYLVRGAAGFMLIQHPMGRSPDFWVWSSLICLSFGVVHLIGLKKQWKNL
jgi:hypothetical protein